MTGGGGRAKDAAARLAETDDDPAAAPFASKVGAILNFNGAFGTAIAVMTMVAVNNFSGNEKIYALSRLIPLYALGALAAVASIVFGHFVRDIPGAQRPRDFLRLSNILLGASLCMMAASHAVFLWALYTCALALLKS